MEKITKSKGTNDIKEWGKIVQAAYYSDTAVVSAITRAAGAPKGVIMGFTGRSDQVLLLITAACISFAEQTNQTLEDVLADIMVSRDAIMAANIGVKNTQ